MPLRINAGVGYEYTQVESAGQFQPLTGMLIDAADHTAYDTQDAPIEKISVPSSYQYLLLNPVPVVQPQTACSSGSTRRALWPVRR